MSGAKLFKVLKTSAGYTPVKLKFMNEPEISLNDFINNEDESHVKLKCIYCKKVTDLQIEEGDDIGLIIPVCNEHYLKVLFKKDVIKKMYENIREFILI